MTENRFNTLALAIIKALFESHPKVLEKDPSLKCLMEKDAAALANIIRKRFGTPILPKDYESVAVSLTSPKTAALVFNRIWTMPGLEDSPPKEISVYGATQSEILPMVLALSFDGKFTFERSRETHDLWKSALEGLPIRSGPLARQISETLREELGISSTPIYASAKMRDQEYRSGRTDLILWTLSSVEVVDESKLEWQQVLEFRRDAEARRKYRRFVHWLDSEMVGKPLRFIEDAISVRLDDYRWAIKKHGIRCVLGVLSSLLDPKFLVASAAAIGAVNLTGDQVLAGLTGFSLVSGRIVLEIAKSLVDAEEAKRGEVAEVAFVYEVEKKLKSDK
jgi:hypothetical protein